MAVHTPRSQDRHATSVQLVTDLAGKSLRGSACSLRAGSYGSGPLAVRFSSRPVSVRGQSLERLLPQLAALDSHEYETGPPANVSG
jgi:hypothetical protein